jgi:hypothetical protein
MAGKTLDLCDVISPDQMACEISRMQQTWFNYLQQQRQEWTTIRNYVFATSTKTTAGSSLPWKNSTTVPKLCQIRDNLYANYMATIFPKRKWLEWQADTENSNSQDKRRAILNYMNWAVSQPQFKPEMGKIVMDIIDTGNGFAMPDWADFRQNMGTSVKSGFVGPIPKRISTLDMTFNPLASSFQESPKIIRSLLTIGELKKKLNSMSTDENHEEYEDLFNYLVEYRYNVRQSGSDLATQDSWYQVDGFSSFRNYLESDFVEVLTFYGDLYDIDNKQLLENHVIMVADRHKLISKKPNPSTFGYAPIYHCGWRYRQDNLWAMSPLANLVGMQYRIDHLENMQADVLDLIGYPVLKIKGSVDDFEWGPLERITINSEDGDVEMLAPPFQVLQLDSKIQMYLSLMEELAGSPKEAMGFRTPGEKTAFEVQRLENAAARIFNNKTLQIEDFEEQLLNGMLELARRNIQGPQEINVFDDEFKFETFQTLTPDDISGAGRLKPIAARNFAEKAELVQNLTQLYSTLMQADPDLKAHFSSIELAKIIEYCLNLEDFKLVGEYIRIHEQHDAQRLNQAGQEEVMMEQQQSPGLTPEDSDQPVAP